MDLRRKISGLDVFLVPAENRLRVEKQPAGKMVSRSWASIARQPTTIQKMAEATAPRITKYFHEDYALEKRTERPRNYCKKRETLLPKERSFFDLPFPIVCVRRIGREASRAGLRSQTLCNRDLAPNV